MEDGLLCNYDPYTMDYTVKTYNQMLKELEDSKAYIEEEMESTHQTMVNIKAHSGCCDSYWRYNEGLCDYESDLRDVIKEIVKLTISA